jgi:hypothetical protein
LPGQKILLSKILFIGLNDYMLRNLLCSSFPERSRELDLPLHGLVYPESYPVYAAMLKRNLGMATEPQELVRLSDWNVPVLERMAFRSALYRSSRVGSYTYRAGRRQGWFDNGKGMRKRLKLELAFLAGQLGGAMGWDQSITVEFYRNAEKATYVQEVCIPRLKQLAPALLVSASPETFYDVPWLLAAGLLGIPRAVWIRSWDNITSKVGVLPDAETFIVWSELMARELRQYFPEYADRKVITIGALQFDGHRDSANIMTRHEFCGPMGLSPKKPIVLYCTGGPHILVNEHLVIQDLQKIASEMPKSTRPQILVRLHPYSWNTDLRAYENLRQVCVWPRQKDAATMAGGSTTGLIDDYKVMLSSFYHQAVNVNVASTVTLDSVVLDKPVINIAYDGPQKLHPSICARRVYRYDHYRHVVNSGAVSLAHSFDGLRRSLEQALIRPDLQHQQRQELVRLECGEVDGRAGERLADAIAICAGDSVTGQQQSITGCVA